MKKFEIRKISNGWILQGYVIDNVPTEVNQLSKKEIFLPNMHAVADIIENWEMAGFVKAAILADKKYNFVGR